MIQVNCTTININSAPTLNLSTGRVYTAERESSSRSIFRLLDDDGGSTGNFWADGQIVYPSYSVPVGPGAYEGPVLEVKPTVEIPQQLVIVGDQFRTLDNKNYNWKGHIDWMLYKRSLDGVSIEPLLQQRYAAGSRSVATLMQAHYIERFIPSEYGQRYYDHMPAFAEALKNYGFYWQPTVYADEQEVKSGHEFVYKCAEQFQNRYWIIPSLGNEYPKNGFDPGAFVRPNTNNFWSRGSNTGDSAPWYPSWDWKEWHPRRDYPKVWFGNEDMWYVQRGVDANLHQTDKAAPCVATEPIGFWNQSIPDRRSNDPYLARVIGGTSVYYGRGSNFMSEQGLRCEMFDPVTFECAVQQFKGINQ